MAGHSHWANIRRKKERKDLKRAKVFSHLSKMVTTAVKDGGKDPEMNPSLKLAIEKAKAGDMPKENIEKAIRKGSGELSGENGFKEIILELYGPEGFALIIKGLTDNKNRTLSDISQILKDFGGSLAKPGSVSWLFDSMGVIEVPFLEENELKAIEAGAEAIDYRDDTLLVYTLPDKLIEVKNNLKKSGIEIESYELGYKPKTNSNPTEKQEKFLSALEELEEADQIYFTTK